MIAKILVWYLLIVYILETIVRLYLVSKGYHCVEHSPLTNAIIAVWSTIVAFLIWLYLIPLVS